MGLLITYLQKWRAEDQGQFSSYQWLPHQSLSVLLVGVSFTGSLLLGSYLAFLESWGSMNGTVFQYNQSLCDTMYFICAFIDFTG